MDNDVSQNYQARYYQGQEQLPNSTAVLVMGIISIPLCICYGVFGLALGIVALALASKANTLYQQNPERYSIASYNNLKAGKICAIIGVIISSLWFLYFIIVFLLYGFALSSLPWHMMR